jgi:hypothetical protein
MRIASLRLQLEEGEETSGCELLQLFLSATQDEVEGRQAELDETIDTFRNEFQREPGRDEDRVVGPPAFRV